MSSMGSVEDARADRIPTIEDMHKVLGDAARAANTQLSGSKVDEYTTLRAFTYDKGVPRFTYHYTTTLGSVARDAMIERHIRITCASQFVSFMRVFKLEVGHRYRNYETGLELISIIVRASDCSDR